MPPRIRSLDVPVTVWADVDVKHGVPVAQRPIGEMAADTFERGLAQAVIVTGRATGEPVEIQQLGDVPAAVPGAPIYVGSGTSIEMLAALLEIADGAIVGTAAKVDGVVTNPVSAERVSAIVAAAR